MAYNFSSISNRIAEKETELKREEEMCKVLETKISQTLEEIKTISMKEADLEKEKRRMVIDIEASKSALMNEQRSCQMLSRCVLSLKDNLMSIAGSKAKLEQRTYAHSEEVDRKKHELEEKMSSSKRGQEKLALQKDLDSVKRRSEKWNLIDKFHEELKTLLTVLDLSRQPKQCDVNSLCIKLACNYLTVFGKIPKAKLSKTVQELKDKEIISDNPGNFVQQSPAEALTNDSSEDQQTNRTNDAGQNGNVVENCFTNCAVEASACQPDALEQAYQSQENCEENKTAETAANNNKILQQNKSFRKPSPFSTIRTTTQPRVSPFSKGFATVATRKQPIASNEDPKSSAVSASSLAPFTKRNSPLLKKTKSVSVDLNENKAAKDDCVFKKPLVPTISQKTAKLKLPTPAADVTNTPSTSALPLNSQVSLDTASSSSVAMEVDSSPSRGLSDTSNQLAQIQIEKTIDNEMNAGANENEKMPLVNKSVPTLETNSAHGLNTALPVFSFSQEESPLFNNVAIDNVTAQPQNSFGFLNFCRGFDVNSNAKNDKSDGSTKQSTGVLATSDFLGGGIFGGSNAQSSNQPGEAVSDFLSGGLFTDSWNSDSLGSGRFGSFLFGNDNSGSGDGQQSLFLSGGFPFSTPNSHADK